MTLSNQDNNEGGGIGLGNNPMSMTNTWGFDGLSSQTDDDAASNTAQGDDDESREDSLIPGSDDDPPVQGFSPDGETFYDATNDTSHVEDAESDRVEEIHLNASSSGRADTDAGLD